MAEPVACPFCARISGGEATYEHRSVVAFPDAFPLTKGHTLVVPLRHVESYVDLEETETADMWKLARVVCDDIIEAQGADGFNIGLNVGEAAGQTIPHVHLHVIPRFHGDTDDPRGGIRWIVPSKARYWGHTERSRDR
jgi:diadenosine tetraphosphate (Ap4A) HIT family hydrolase